MKKKWRKPLAARVTEIMVHAAGGKTAAEVKELQERVVELKARSYNCHQVVAELEVQLECASRSSDYYAILSDGDFCARREAEARADMWRDQSWGQPSDDVEEV